MAYNLQIVLFCACLLVVTIIAHPQVWDIGFNPRQTTGRTSTTTVAGEVDQDPNSTPTTAAPTVRVTTPSSAYFDCIARCPTTSEYNPICGSDSVNYHNMGRLECAARCGMNVTMVRGGTCTPAG